MNIRIEKYEAQEKQEWEQSRVLGTKPTYDLIKYAGIYTSSIYGDVKVEIKNDKLYLSMLETLIFQGELSHWHYDTFSVSFPKVPSLPAGSVSFISDKTGNIVEMKMDIPNPDFDFTELKLYKKD